MSEDKMITKEVLHKVCKPGQGAKTCRYVAVSADGFECAKHTILRKTIDSKTDMIARGDNCIGLGRVKFCKCGSIMERGKCTRLRCPVNPAQYKMWVIDNKFHEFPEPVTLDVALASVKTKGLLN